MTGTSSTNGGETYTVVNGVNDHGAATLRAENGSTIHVTSYEDEALRDYLARHQPGDRVRMEVVRDGVRANVWRVSALYPGANNGA